MPDQQLNIKFDDQTAKGTYANNLMIQHTKEEFLLDFLNILPPQGVLVSRIITSPNHAKRILRALEENIKVYEKSFGKLTESSVPDRTIGFKP
ncbi:MAG: DUF3467 domain-containing protein [Candidatus Berkelbacteria bacterium]|nr:DUF3467 domain-containing protein [Candidatus Berkelbacteria bacterium]